VHPKGTQKNFWRVREKKILGIFGQMSICAFWVHTHFFLFHFYLAPISSFSYLKTHALVRLVSDDTQSPN